MKSLLTVKEVAERLAKKPGWVYDMTERGGIPAIRVGRQIRFDPDEIDRWIDERRTPNTPPPDPPPLVPRVPRRQTRPWMTTQTRDMLLDAIEPLCRELDSRRNAVMANRLDGKSYRALADELHLSVERVRQLERDAWEKIRTAVYRGIGALEGQETALASGFVGYGWPPPDQERSSTRTEHFEFHKRWPGEREYDPTEDADIFTVDDDGEVPAWVREGQAFVSAARRARCLATAAWDMQKTLGGSPRPQDRPSGPLRPSRGLARREGVRKKAVFESLPSPPRPGPLAPPYPGENTQRDTEIVLMRGRGVPVSQIAAEFFLTPARVETIIADYCARYRLKPSPLLPRKPSEMSVPGLVPA